MTSRISSFLGWIAVYALWLVDAALGLYTLFMFRTAAMSAYVALGWSRWALAAFDKWLLLFLALGYLSFVLYLLYRMSDIYGGTGKGRGMVSYFMHTTGILVGILAIAFGVMWFTR